MEPIKLNQIQNSMQSGSVARAQSIRASEPAQNADRVSVVDNKKSQDNAVRQTKDRDRDNTGRTAEIQDAAAKGVYGDVLDISEDGDTMSARPEALQKLDDGIVMLRGGEQNTAVNTDNKSAREVTQEEAAKREEIAQALEDKAEASREAREKIREQNEQKAEDAAVAKTEERIRESGASGTEDALTQYGSGSLNGYSDNMVDTLYRQGKIDGRTYNAEESRRERLDEAGGASDDNRQQAINDNNEFNNRMGELNAASDNDTLESDALLTAAENRRVGIIKDIFDSNSNE